MSNADNNDGDEEVSNGGGDVPQVSEDDVETPPVVREVTTVTTGLYVPGKIEIVFYDWDTLVDANFAGKVLLLCDPTYNYSETGCDGAESCMGPDSLSDALLGQENPAEFVAENAWGGRERLERIQRHFEHLQKTGIEVNLFDEIWGC